MFCNNNNQDNAATTLQQQPAKPAAQPAAQTTGMPAGGSSAGSDFWKRVLESKLPPAVQTAIQLGGSAQGNKPTTTAGMATPQTAVKPLTDPAPAYSKNNNL